MVFFLSRRRLLHWYAPRSQDSLTPFLCRA
jgi:hypothetical protein